jgi:hypothetical protein
MVNQVTSKKGKTFNDIVSISPASKTAKEVGIDDVPEWMLAEALDYKLADGIGIRAKDESEAPAEEKPKTKSLYPDAPPALPKGSPAKKQLMEQAQEKAQADVNVASFEETDLPF